MEEVEELAAKSSLPETVDRAYWDKFICDADGKRVVQLFMKAVKTISIVKLFRHRQQKNTCSPQSAQRLELRGRSKKVLLKVNQLPVFIHFSATSAPLR